MTNPETAELIEEASAWRQYADGSDHAETHDLVTRMQSELGRLASEVARLQAEAGRLSGELTRIPTFLAERAAWFDYEARHGGDWDHLKRREEECRWIEQAIERGRYREDGRPSWLINAIAVPDRQPSDPTP